MFTALPDEEAMLAVAIDDPLADFEKYAENRQLHSSQSPWGLILSEGAAGAVLTTHSMVDALKLSPIAKIETFYVDHSGADRRACSRLARANSETVKNFGQIYSDITSQRSHSEDYGFAVGARSECFTSPENIISGHQLWGYQGEAAPMTMLALASQSKSSDQKTRTLFLFGGENSRAITTLQSLA